MWKKFSQVHVFVMAALFTIHKIKYFTWSYCSAFWQIWYTAHLKGDSKSHPFHAPSQVRWLVWKIATAKSLLAKEKKKKKSEDATVIMNDIVMNKSQKCYEYND